uniref:Uncharacterized protein n=1 Tax=Staphylothermus marinus TaxID=2280 RepID=A0A7C4DAX5_STAMA
MKAITNYVAALLTLTMIFTSVAFFVSTMIKQSQFSSETMRVMVNVSDRAREYLGIGYVVQGNRLILTIINLGTIEVTPTYIVYIDKDLNVIYEELKGISIPIDSIVKLNLSIPKPFTELRSIKLTTLRGNVFDVLVPTYKPLSITALVNRTLIGLNDVFELTLIIENNLFKDIVIKPDDFTIRFINHINNTEVNTYFFLKKVFPEDPVILRKSEKIVFKFIYQYSGGIVSETPIDIKIDLTILTVNYEEVYTSTYVTYLFKLI